MSVINHASIDLDALEKLDPRELAALLAGLKKADKADLRRKIDHYFPDETHDWRGQTFHSRDQYQRHLEFFEAGATYRQRCFMAGNRVGKTESGGGYEIARHLTGDYPDWWPGRRFDHPIRAWAAGKTNETTRDIIQAKLLGPIAYDGASKTVAGTGVIPGDALGKPNWKSGITDLVDTIAVRHVSGGYSTLGLKSYHQGRGSFEGTEQHVIWLDEEPDLGVYGECLIRTATTHGIIMLTFTPLAGLSEVVLTFMPVQMRPGDEAAY